MNWNDVKGLVQQLAPMIATGLGGPLAGGAVSALEAALGITPTGTLDDRTAAVTTAVAGATQEQLLAIKQADQTYALNMATLGFKNTADLAKIQADDVDSARKREVEVKDNTPKVLSYAITIGFFGVLTFLMFGHVPNDGRDILNVMLGTLGTAWTGVVSYYYGSTSGSAAKSKLLADATATAAAK